jgi:hypothetical protein
MSSLARLECKSYEIGTETEQITSVIKNDYYTPHTLKFGFRFKRDFRDNKDFKDMINNKNRSNTEFSSVMSILSLYNKKIDNDPNQERCQ